MPTFTMGVSSGKVTRNLSNHCCPISGPLQGFVSKLQSWAKDLQFIHKNCHIESLKTNWELKTVEFFGFYDCFAWFCYRFTLFFLSLSFSVHGTQELLDSAWLQLSRFGTWRQTLKQHLVSWKGASVKSNLLKWKQITGQPWCHQMGLWHTSRG